MTLEPYLRVEAVGPSSCTGRVVLGGSSALAGGVGFGGHVVAHSIMAASTIAGTDAVPDSVHTTFLRAVRPDSLVRYDVTAVRTGRAFQVLDVQAWDGETHVAASMVTLTRIEDGDNLQDAPPPVPEPESLPPSTWVPPGTNAAVRAHFDIRDASSSVGTAERGPEQSTWFRTLERLGDEPALHAAAFAWFSDLSMPWTAELPYAGSELVRRGASLDHVLWFHRDFRVDDWLLFAQRNPVYAHSRALTNGHLHDRSGRLVASAAQETLLRRTPPAPPEEAPWTSP